MKYLIMIVLLFSSGQAKGVDVSAYMFANDLLEYCEAQISETGSVAKGNACAGYIMGIVDLYRSLVVLGHTQRLWCHPEKVHSNQLVRIVTKYLQEHPEDLHRPASTLVVNALIKAFPCE